VTPKCGNHNTERNNPHDDHSRYPHHWYGSHIAGMVNARNEPIYLKTKEYQLTARQIVFCLAAHLRKVGDNFDPKDIDAPLWAIDLHMRFDGDLNSWAQNRTPAQVALPAGPRRTHRRRYFAIDFPSCPGNRAPPNSPKSERTHPLIMTTATMELATRPRVGLHPRLAERGLLRRTGAGGKGYQQWLDHVASAAGCVRPIRLTGQLHTSQSHWRNPGHPPHPPIPRRGHLRPLRRP